MNKTARLVFALGLIAIGALGLVGLQAFGAPSPDLATVPAARAAAPVTNIAGTTETAQSVDPALEAEVRDMLKDRMGLSAAEADKLAKSMAEHMQAVHGDQAGAMANSCAAQSDATGGAADSGYEGMMGGSGGMMGGSGDSGNFGGGMMGGSGGSGGFGGGMMGGSGGFGGGMMGGGL